MQKILFEDDETPVTSLYTFSF